MSSQGLACKEGKGNSKFLPREKARCIYTITEEDYKSAMTALQQKLESVSSCFCGDLLIGDDHYLRKVTLQRKALTCKSLIEKGITTTTTGNSS